MQGKRGWRQNKGVELGQCKVQGEGAETETEAETGTRTGLGRGREKVNRGGARDKGWDWTKTGAGGGREAVDGNRGWGITPCTLKSNRNTPQTMCPMMTPQMTQKVIS